MYSDASCIYVCLAADKWKQADRKEQITIQAFCFSGGDSRGDMTARKLTVGIISVLLVAAMMAPSLTAQSLISGDIVGTVTDPSGAVIPNASVELKSLDTGATQSGTTNATGFYRFSLLKPGNYRVAVKESGFATEEVSAVVNVGQSTTANVSMKVSTTAQTIEVTGAPPIVDTTTASISTAFTQREFANLPSPGGDITNIAQTAPGVLLNTGITAGGGTGNFTANGLPGTSNLFTVNGENDMDPYFNINQSGATNLTLGSNEIQEASVVTNAYSGEYGQLAGAQVTYITKSGTNTLHGNAQYWWNGRAVNANDWFNNNTGTPRPFANANQWAGAVGGPIVKDKTFFFFDTEGLRFILPNVLATTIPTPAFEAATLANIQSLQPVEYPAYQKLFNLYNNAPGASGATPIPNTAYCQPFDPVNNPLGLVLPGFDGSTQPCAAKFQATPSSLGSEWILAFRIDQNIGQNDKLYGRYKQDRGTQPSYIDAISSNFDALSKQPSWDVQVQETHIFSASKTNEFTAAGSHYVAQFAQNEQLALSTFPAGILTNGSVPFSGFGGQYGFPQGRNITQYQFIDNLTWSHGSHTFKFGGNFRRYDVSDHNFFFENPGVYFGYSDAGLQQMVDGLAFQYRQTSNLASNVPIALWGLGVYGMDTWKVKRNLTLTLALRTEYNSNPVCQINCLANFKTDWFSLPSVLAGAGAGDVPYTSDIGYNLHKAYPGVDAIDLSPRFGFSWSPGSSGKTVISGGFGLFYDNPAAGLVDDLLANPPVAAEIRVRPPDGTLPFDPNGGPAAYQASAAAFQSGFANGETYSQIVASFPPGITFAAPAFTAITGKQHAPRWQEWNLQLQQELTPSTVLSANYVGNHGIRIPYENSWYNAYDAGFGYPGQVYPTIGFDPQVPNYGTVNQVLSGAVSNYNGLTVGIHHNFTHWFSAHANYTWSHNMDEVSNGGLFAYSGADSAIPLQQLCPGSLKQCNYGNSDYDVRHSFSADFVVQPSYHVGNRFANAALGGWQWSGKVFWRSGTPFSVVDANWNGGIFNTQATTLAYITGGPLQTACGGGNATGTGNVQTPPCLNANAFLDSSGFGIDPNYPYQTVYPGFSNQRRNSLVGPHFFDVDMSLFKTFKLTERLAFGVGAQAYNVFNHPNFANPNNYLLSGDTTFGQISTTALLPTSPYGTFLGFDSSPRVLQISGKITF